MYAYTYDPETGGILLNDSTPLFSKEPRPVYAREMDILGFDQQWKYDKQDDFPYMWAESNVYWYRGVQAAKTRGGSLYVKPEIEYLSDADGKLAVPEGETLQPVDLETMCEKNRGLLDVLEQMTVKKIFDVYKRYRKKLDCFHVAFSGGKDSIVLLELVKKALPKSSFVVVFGDTGMEFPDTYDVIDRVETQCREEKIEFYRAASHLQPEESWRLFGPPSRVLRWCCSVHKSTPQTLKLRNVLGKDNFVGMDFVGVRADESSTRAGYEYENFGKKQRGQYSHNSILEWSSAEIWLYIFSNDLIINQTYKKGNSRAGCLFCPMGSGKSDFFRYTAYPEEIDKYIQIIRETIEDKNIETYITNGGWIERKNGRDLRNNQAQYIEERKDGFLYIIIKNPLSDWQEWIKTLGEIPFEYVYTELENGFSIRVSESVEKSPHIKLFKQVFHKAAHCVSCRVCESNCRHGCISFKDKLRIDNCLHCGACHNIDDGCIVYHSIQLPLNGGHIMKSLNTFADHAPKPEWLTAFFQEPETFVQDNMLGPMQIGMFKRFLADANLLFKNQPTDFEKIIEKINWDSEAAWGLILAELASRNPQIQWYIKNMPLGASLEKKELESMLVALAVKEKDAQSIRKAFKRLCDLPLGTVLNFGVVEKSGKEEYLTRTKTCVSDARVILYSLYKYAEACEGYYQFSLARLMDNTVESAGVSPAQIFGLDRDEMEQFLNAASVKYPEFIHVSFTHDLDKIDLREDKSSQDVLTLF